MESFSKIVRAKPDTKKIYSKEQALADEVWQYFGKKIPFGRIMFLIKTKGWQFIFECLQETKKANHPNHLALFLWKTKQAKVEMKDLSTE